MNPFHAHGIHHVSASNIGSFITCPARWAATYLLGYRGPPSAAMERGKAAETGIVARLTGASPDEAYALALEQFDTACQGEVSGDVMGERVNLTSFIDTGYMAVAHYGKPTFPDEGGQIKIEIDCAFGSGAEDHIPIIGYLDLDFDEAVIDLKSTGRIPSEMNIKHRIQHSIYSRVTNKPVKFCYFSRNKTATLDDPDTMESQRIVRSTVRRMANLLRAFPTKEELIAAVPIVLDGWAWKGDEAKRREFFEI